MGGFAANLHYGPGVHHLSEVVDFEVLLARDDELAAREGASALLVRDRTLGAQLLAERPHGQLRAWLGRRRSVERDLPGDRASTLITLVGWGLLLLGVAAGASTAAALLAYDGRSPVNVLAWLLYMAAVPLFLALVLVVGLLVPKRWFARAGAAQVLLGAILEPLLRRLPGGDRWARTLFGRQASASGLQRWMLVGLTQVFSLGFLGAALAALLIKVAITDLTFSWSTTLDLSDQHVTQMVDMLATPWADLVPGAVPNEEAVAQSNYRRFVDRFRDTDQRTPVDAAIGATWWKLCAASVIVYGLLPRLLLLLVSLWRWRAALARWPSLDRPDVHALLDRLEDPGGTFVPRQPTPPQDEVLSQPTLPAQDRGPPTTPSPPASLEMPAPPQEDLRTLTVAWGMAAADLEAVSMAFGAEPSSVMSAGADLDLSAERRVLSAAAEEGGPVTVLMPMAEPPVEDVLGFLRELRSVSPRVEIVPLKRSNGQWRTSSTDSSWSKALARVRGVEVRKP